MATGAGGATATGAGSGVGTAATAAGFDVRRGRGRGGALVAAIFASVDGFGADAIAGVGGGGFDPTSVPTAVRTASPARSSIDRGPFIGGAWVAAAEAAPDAGVETAPGVGAACPVPGVVGAAAAAPA